MKRSEIIKKLNLKKRLAWVVKYRYFIISITTVLLFIVALYRIDSFSSAERNETLYEEKVLTIDKIKFDDESIKRITELQDLNVEVGSQFEAGRNNPFLD